MVIRQMQMEQIKLNQQHGNKSLPW
jgi:hypothetical protein